MTKESTERLELATIYVRAAVKQLERVLASGARKKRLGGKQAVKRKKAGS